MTVNTNIGQITASRETLKKLKDIVLSACVNDSNKSKDETLRSGTRAAYILAYEQDSELWNQLHDSLS